MGHFLIGTEINAESLDKLSLALICFALVAESYAVGGSVAARELLASSKEAPSSAVWPFRAIIRAKGQNATPSRLRLLAQPGLLDSSAFGFSYISRLTPPRFNTPPSRNYMERPDGKLSQGPREPQTNPQSAHHAACRSNSRTRPLRSARVSRRPLALLDR